MTALQTKQLDQALWQIGIFWIQPIIHVLVHDERPAIGHVDIPTITQRPFLFGGGSDDLRDQLLPIRCAFEHSSHSSRKCGEIGEIQRVEFIKENRFTAA
jgi:hypothetical protein